MLVVNVTNIYFSIVNEKDIFYSSTPNFLLAYIADTGEALKYTFDSYNGLRSASTASSAPDGSGWFRV